MYRIARRNVLVGVVLSLGALAIPVASWIVTVDREGGFLVYSAALLIAGLERLFRGCTQNGALKRLKKYGARGDAGRNVPNKSLQPTATAVMPPADAADHASRGRG